MDLWKDVAGSVTKAVQYVMDQNRRAAMVNRLKAVIRNEKEIEARSYMELGKYYRENMRDPENPATEKLCVSIDNSERRLKRAFSKLDELIVPEEPCEKDAAKDFRDEEPEGRNPASAKPGEPPAEDEDDFFRPFSEAQEKNGGDVSPDEEAPDDSL